jgi:cytochrome d ubiquinol oxidase subunit I
MVGLGGAMLLLALWAWLASRRGRVPAAPLLLKLLPLAIPLPYLAIQLGWVVAEIGRQPWLVYGVFKTADGASKSVSAGQVAFSLAGFVLVYGILAAVDAILLMKYARKGPEEASR